MRFIAWHQWPARFASELAAWRSGCCPAWALPATGGREEEADLLSRRPSPVGAGLVAVESDDEDSALVLSDVLTSAGYSVAAYTRPRPLKLQGVSAVVLDRAAGDSAAANRVEQLAVQHPGASILALVHFPLPEQIAALEAAGAAAVLGKPFTLGDFLGELTDRVERPTSTATRAA